MLRSSLTTDRIEAGCDEAGRGCLAGPVFAAAVILPKDYRHPLLNDSKQLSVKQRALLREEILREALACAVASVDNRDIDRINILQASILAMHLALGKLPVGPELILVDGNRFLPFHRLPHQCIVKGDGQFASIAAASVLAKTARDELMDVLHKEFPAYGWAHNKGYPTAAHLEALKRHGVTPYHRLTFQPVRQTTLRFDSA